MESPKIKVPINDIYKVHLLDYNGNTQHIYVFCNKTINTQNMHELFSDPEILKIKHNNINVEFVNSLIHKDDSINTIKRKIIHEIGENNICYEEMYLFVNILEKINIMLLYQSITHSNEYLTFNMIKQLLLNLNLKNVDEIMEKMEYKDNYNYDDLLKIIEYNKYYSISIPFGQKFSENRDYVFSSNPFKLFSNNDGVIDFTKNSLINFENQLLLNYSNIENQNIYLCLYNDVIDFTKKITGTCSYIPSACLKSVPDNLICCIPANSKEL